MRAAFLGAAAVAVVVGAVALLCYLIIPDGETASAAQLSPEVQSLCDDFWQWGLQDRPEYATFVGVHDFDDRLDDLSSEAFEARMEAVQGFLARVNDLEPGLTEDSDLINIRVLRDTLQTFTDGYRFKQFYIAVTHMDGIQQTLLKLISWMPRETEANYRTVLRRLQKLPLQLQQIMSLLKEGVKAGITQHHRSMQKVGPQIEVFVVNDSSDSSIYQKFFVDLPPGVPRSIQDDARNIITDEVTPAFRELLLYVTESYVTRPNIGVTSLPNGTDLYAEIIKFHTGSEDSPENIQQTGFEEVERIGALMQEIVHELGYKLTVQEFSSMLLSDPHQHCSTEQELLDAVNHLVHNVTTSATASIFKNRPTIPIEVEPDPSVTLAYYSGPIEGLRSGVFTIGTQDLKSRPKFTLLTLSLHEANPGHHFQNSYAIQSPSIPVFRYSSMAYFGCSYAPSRFPQRAYYGEGWALYAESTGFDMGLFGDHLDLYGHYSHEAFRAARLVVDTGLHALGWSRDQAVEYMLQHIAMTRIVAENEVDRYIACPGQALSYKTGQLQLAALREKAEQTLGDQFDLKDFHEVILSSVGPMSVVKDEVDKWVSRACSSGGCNDLTS